MGDIIRNNLAGFHTRQPVPLSELIYSTFYVHPLRVQKGPGSMYASHYWQMDNRRI
jgi:hypothetical protein